MCHNLEKHLNGIISASPIVILQISTGNYGKTTEIQVCNSEYITWKKMNQSLVAYITATLSNEVFYTISDNIYRKKV